MSEADLDELYQDILLEHFRHPRHKEPLAEDEVLADEENTNCGDRIRVALSVSDGVVVNPRFDGSGCAISMASASILCDYAAGRPVEDVRGKIDAFIAMMRGERPFGDEEIDDLEALGGVRRYPLRVKCATMSWHALRKAIDRAASASGG